MSQLLRGIRQAHAQEVAARIAYDHHYRALLGRGRLNAARYVWRMLKDEQAHINDLHSIMLIVRTQESRIRDGIFTVIGTLVGWSCYVLPLRWSAYGAQLIERLGKTSYKKLAKLARDEGYPAVAVEFDYMERAEAQHEIWLREKKCE